jgi:cytochrome b561
MISAYSSFIEFLATELLVTDKVSMSIIERMRIIMVKNSKSSYGWLAIALHWLMAIGIFFLFGLGLYMVELTYYDAWYRGSLELHKSLGLVLLFVWLGRVVWRWLNTSPTIQGTELEKKAAHVVHLFLYVLMLALMVTGYLISTADGRGIEVFALFEIPALPISFENQEDIAGEVHEAIAWVLILMVGLHSLAAVKHQLINKDGTLMKMIRPKADS